MSAAASSVFHPAFLLFGLVQRTGQDDSPDLAATPPASSVSHPVNLLLGLVQTAGPTTDRSAVSELARESVSTVRPRRRTTSASEDSV